MAMLTTLKTMLRLLFNQRGETAENVNPAPAPTDHWSGSLPDDLRTIPAVKESADLPSFVKRFNDQSSELGRRVRIPDGKDETAYKAFQDSVKKAGMTVMRGVAPDEYAVNRAENIPEAAWSQKTVDDFKGWAKKWSLPQSAVDEIVAMDAARFGELEPTFKANHDELKKQVTEQWQKEGRTYEQMMDLALEGVAKKLTPDEFKLLEATGLADHPLVLSGLAKIGEAFMESSGLTGTMSDANRGVAQEAESIVKDKSNPKHEAFWRGDPNVKAEVEELYRRAYPGVR